MGADLVGWRGCRLQEELGPEGFLGKLKLRAYQAAVERQVPEDRREKVTLRVVRYVSGEAHPTELSYTEIRDEAEAFSRGTDECADCPLSSGNPLGCYRYMTYPIDPGFERLLFDFFESCVYETDSICDQLYRDIISNMPPDAMGFNEQRGAEPQQGCLAQRAAPFVHEGERTFNSGQLIAMLFVDEDNPAFLVAMTRFWTELVGFADERLEQALGADGSAQIHVPSDGDAERTAERAIEAVEELQRLTESRNLTEARSISHMYIGLLAGVLDQGWTILIDA